MARPSDQAGRASHGAAKASPPSGDHPSRVRHPERNGPTDRQVAAAEAVLAKRRASQVERDAAAEVQCAAYGASRFSPIAEPCGAWFPIAEAVYVDTLYWVPPYGCTGGAYWRSGEGSFVCPKCGFLNRTYQREGVAKLSSHFKRAVTAYTPESCFASGLDFKEGGYPFPKHVAARLKAEADEREASRLTARAAALRAASGMEARRAAAENTDAVHDSPTAESGDAQ